MRTVCALCRRPEGHSSRCSVMKFGVPEDEFRMPVRSAEAEITALKGLLGRALPEVNASLLVAPAYAPRAQNLARLISEIEDAIR